MSNHLPINIAEIDQNYLDGILALQVLLSQGLDISIYQRQILIVHAPSSVDLVFTHGIPDTTNLTSAVTVQHKRMRRALLEKAHVRIPKGASFSVGRGVAQAHSFADKLGYPVVVKPSKGDIGTYNFLNVSNPNDLDQAIAAMKVPVHEREGVFRANYTPMELGQPGFEDGKQTVTPSYRFLIEERKTGELIRFLVDSGEIVSAVKLVGSPMDGTLRSSVDTLRSVPSVIREMVINAYNAVPHISVASIDVVYGGPQGLRRRRKATVVDFSERPFLWVQAISDPHEALRLSAGIVRRQFVTRSIPFTEVQEETSVGFEILALPSASTAASALPSAAVERGVRCTITDASDLEGHVSGRFEGSALAIATLLNDLTNDLISDVPAMTVEVRAQSD